MSVSMMEKKLNMSNIHCLIFLKFKINSHRFLEKQKLKIMSPKYDALFTGSVYASLILTTFFLFVLAAAAHSSVYLFNK